MKACFKGINGIKIMKNEPLKKYTSFRIGGKASYFIKVYNQRALFAVMKVIKRKKMRYLIIGEGTNVLFQDKGYDGVIIKLMGSFRKIKNCGEMFLCGAGTTISNFLNQAMKKGYGGAEFLAGIPGSIGGAVMGNAGAFGHAISEIVERLIIIDAQLEKRIVPRDDVIFRYRYSNIAEGSIIVAVELKMKKSSKKVIQEKIKNHLEIRWEKQPRGLSAGSFFKNPLPLSAGQLIEECGLKGLRIGDAQVSEKHANFIINLGQAKAQDVIRLMKVVRAQVKRMKGIDLQPEVRIIT
ncbi:MAG: UDP-N-acetylmuramate dehydrogenase [bacterium]